MIGIDSQYDFELTFAQEANLDLPTGAPPGPNGQAIPTDPAPSVFDALKLYGFRLEACKAAVEMLTVTHLEKTPTES
jgi:uncharacterized protein (TIGR03435 family)